MSNHFVPIKKAELEWHGDLPFSIQYDDIYHSSEGSINQSHYVFVEGNDLINRWQSFPTSHSHDLSAGSIDTERFLNSADNSAKKSSGQNMDRGKKLSKIFTIGETGFGTGLNFLVSWKLWEEHAPMHCQLHFISCEKHPLSHADLKKCLACWPQLESQAQQLLEAYPILTPGYHHLSFSNGRVVLTLLLGDAYECYEQLLVCGEPKLESELRTSFIDAWYLDGFSPDKNESMWSESLIKTIAMLSREGTTLATYTAAGSVKSNLRQYGFHVVKKKGFGPKRHMITANFTSIPSCANKKRHTPWHVSIPEKPIQQSALIIGAGLAGCFTAYSLAKRGWKVLLIDELNQVGSSASANQQAVLFPKLSAYSSPLTQFMLAAFLYATKVYQSILKQESLGDLNGSILLAHNAKEQLAQASLANWLGYYPELGGLVDFETASELSGLSLNQTGLFIPLSGWINSHALCHYLIKRENISLVTNTSIERLIFDKRWVVNDWESDVVILANGYKINSFKETEHLPVKPIRGQMTTILATKQSSSLKIPLCAEGHVLPAINGMHHVGATYELKAFLPDLKRGDDLINLAKLNQLAPEVSWSSTVTNHWAGIRATTPDYLPLVGKIAKPEQFIQIFAGLETNSKRWIAEAGPYYPGLYACAGFGSRGLTTIPLCAEWLAAQINNEMSCLPRNLQQALSPARFLRKNIIRGL